MDMIWSPHRLPGLPASTSDAVADCKTAQLTVQLPQLSPDLEQLTEEGQGGWGPSGRVSQQACGNVLRCDGPDLPGASVAATSFPLATLPAFS